MNIKKTICTLCMLLGLLPAAAQRATLIFDVPHTEGAYPYVVYGQQQLKAETDASGRKAVVIAMDMPAYVTVYFSKLDGRMFYIEPGKQLVLKYQLSEDSKSLTLSGDLAAENQYLRSLKWAGPLPFSRDRSLQSFMQKSDSLTAIDRTRLDSQPFSSTFKEWERKRIELHAMERLLRVYTKDTVTFLSLLKDRMVKDATWLRIPEYLRLADQYIRLLVRFGSDPKKMLEGEELADKRLECIKTHVPQPDIAGYLVDITLFHLAELNIPRYNELYHRYVKDPQRIALYEAVTQKAASMAAGKPCPDFCFADNKGSKVRLADLRGKYVYIDLWATWCGPCKGEMPALLEIEKKFADKDIHFVSISVDANKHVDLWKKTIEQMGLKGIQLHLGEQWGWLKTFMPSSISVPRFILLDREGRILDAHAPRPSDKSFANRLEQLLASGAWR